jgi:hypothetical protein
LIVNDPILSLSLRAIKCLFDLLFFGKMGSDKVLVAQGVRFGSVPRLSIALVQKSVKTLANRDGRILGWVLGQAALGFPWV